MTFHPEADRPTGHDATPPRRPRTARRWNLVFVALLVIVVALIVGWLFTSSEDGAPIVSKSAIASTCRSVAAVLADGPDQSVDPVGYAEAQVGPLGRVRAADVLLHRAIEQLRRAYQGVYLDGATPATRATLAKAVRRMDHLCPGAALS